MLCCCLIEENRGSIVGDQSSRSVSYYQSHETIEASYPINIKLSIYLLKNQFRCKQTVYRRNGLIQVNPQDFVSFRYDPVKLSQGVFTVTSIAEGTISFKIRTTNPKMYQVKPSLGYIQPNTTVTVEVITTQPFQQDNSELKDKFQVLATNVSDSEMQVDLGSLWKARDQKDIQSIAMKTKLINKQSNPAGVMEPIAEENQLQTSNDDKIFHSVVGKPAQQIQQQQPQPVQTQQRTPSLGAAPQVVPQEFQREEIKDPAQYYQQECQRLTKEISDLKLAYQSLQNQKSHSSAQHQGDSGQFTLKQLLIVLVMSLILGAIAGNR